MATLLGLVCVSAFHADLSDMNKFNYLRSFLGGTALKAISRLSLTAANYNEAVALLKRRFGKKQQLISRHMDILLNVEAVTFQHNLKNFRHLYDTVESN